MPRKWGFVYTSHRPPVADNCQGLQNSACGGVKDNFATDSTAPPGGGVIKKYNFATDSSTSLRTQMNTDISLYQTQTENVKDAGTGQKRPFGFKTNCQEWLENIVHQPLDPFPNFN